MCFDINYIYFVTCLSEGRHYLATVVEISMDMLATPVLLVTNSRKASVGCLAINSRKASVGYHSNQQ
jgi:hypothetical protein